MQLLSQIIHIYDKFFVNNKFILGNHNHKIYIINIIYNTNNI